MLGMEHRSKPNNAAENDAQIKSSKEECASGMGHRSNDAAEKDAQITLNVEECASGMVQGSKYAVVKDVEIMFKTEECVLGMGQRSKDTTALLMDVQTTPSVEECAGGTVHIAIHKTNLLHLGQNSRQLLINPYPIIAPPKLPSEDQETGTAFLEKCPSFVKKL